ASEVRHAFVKGNGNLGENGSVSWIFELKGLITLDIGSLDEEALMEAALDAGAEDVIVNVEDNVYEVITEPPDFLDVRDALKDAGFPMTLADITMIPKNTVAVEGKSAGQLIRLIDSLEDLDDVQAVYANFEMSSEDMEEAV
ncbi:MAG: YebC/PmpR family DNA-binding transcriptional regulator, partial [Thermodesulfobacteriota bacterium]